MATSSPTTSPATYQKLFGTLAQNFAAPQDVAKCFAIICPGKSITDLEIVGNGVSLEELVVANVDMYANEVLSNAGGRYYMLKDTQAFIDEYLKMFDVVASGPDLIKYTLAFGMGLEQYTVDLGERVIITALVRVQTLRLLRAAAGIARADQIPPPLVMAKKIVKVWTEDRRADLLGKYGTYMALKTWSLG